MAKKNYGIYNYSKNRAHPTAEDSAKYLAEIFDVKDTTKIKKILREYGYNDEFGSIEYSAGYVRTIFLEKQLIKHGRKRLAPKVDLSLFEGTTLRSIAKSFVEMSNNLQKGLSESDDVKRNQAQKTFENTVYPLASAATSFRRSLNAPLINKKPAAQKKGAQKKITQEELNKIANVSKAQLPDTKFGKEIAREMSEGYVQRSVEEIENEHKKGRKTCQMNNGGASEAAEEAAEKMRTDITGKYKSVGLSRTLSKVLDNIIGQAEKRSLERGFNRPSRFGHFVKNCFLPVYRCNKPHKRPAFYIDSSGSMQSRRGDFNCVTSAIAAFLRTNHRKISELRPKYFAFDSKPWVYEFNVLKQLPVACGGTSLEFIANIDDKEKSIIITDAEFCYSELAQLRLWAANHKSADIHWVTNDEHNAEGLRTALMGFPNQKVYYAEF